MSRGFFPSLFAPETPPFMGATHLETRDSVNPRLCRHFFRFNLVPHAFHRARRGTHERYFRFLARLCERRIFAQKTVPVVCFRTVPGI